MAIDFSTWKKNRESGSAQGNYSVSKIPSTSIKTGGAIPYDEWKKKRKPQIDQFNTNLQAEQERKNQDPPVSKPVDQIEHEERKSWEEMSFLEKSKATIKEVPNTIGNAVKKGATEYNEFWTQNSLAFSDKYREQDPTGAKAFLNPTLDKYNNPDTSEEEKIAIRKMVSENDIQDDPILQKLNTETGKKITGFIGEHSSNLGLKGEAAKRSLNPFGDKTYQENLDELLKDRNNPDNNLLKKIAYGVQDSGFQSAIGVLLNFVPYAGRALSSAYYASISANSQVKEKGRAESTTGIAIDTIGDNVLSDVAEQALKNVAKEGGKGLIQAGKNFLKGGAVEGGTEVTQTVLNLSNEYANATDGETRSKIVQQLKDYITKGGMTEEFLVAGASGGLINTGAGMVGSRINSNINVQESQIEPEREGSLPPDGGTPPDGLPQEAPQKAMPAETDSELDKRVVDFVSALGENNKQQISALESELTVAELNQVMEKLDQAYNVADPETKQIIGNDFEYVTGLLADREDRVKNVAVEVVSKKTTENLENDIEGLNVSEVQEVNEILDKAKEVLKTDFPKVTNSTVQTVEKAKTAIEELKTQKKDLLAKKSEVKEVSPEAAKEIQTTIDKVDKQIFENKDLIKQPKSQAGLFEAPVSRREKIETLSTSIPRAQLNKMPGKELTETYKKTVTKKEAQQSEKAPIQYKTRPDGYREFIDKSGELWIEKPMPDGMEAFENLDTGKIVSKTELENAAKTEEKKYGVKYKNAISGKMETKEFPSKKATEEAADLRRGVGRKATVVEIAEKKKGDQQSEKNSTEIKTGSIVTHKGKEKIVIKTWSNSDGEGFSQVQDKETGKSSVVSDKEISIKNETPEENIEKNPLAVNPAKIFYHGTVHEFEEFSNNEAGKNTEADNAKFGIFFLEDEQRAKTFATENTDFEYKGGEVKVKKVTLDMKNPIDLTLKGIFTNEKQASFVVELLGGEKGLSSKEALEFLDENIGLGEIGELSEALYGDIKNKKIMQDAGYDGIISEFGKDNEGVVLEYVVFDASQIKNVPKEAAASVAGKAKNHVEKFTETIKNLRNGETTLGEYKQGYADILANKEAILEELSKKKKDELLRIIGGIGAYHYKNELKDRVVSAAYDSMVQDFTLARTVTYSIGGDGMKGSIDKMVEETTEADLQEFADRVKEARLKREEQLLEMKKLLENPETLDEFRKFIEVKGIKALTADQLAKYDDLVALEAKKKYEAEKEKRANIQGIMADTEVEIKQTKHTKTGEDLFVAVLSKRVEKDVYQELNTAAKRLGGWYSSFRGTGAIPGFQFKSQEEADQFAAVVKGENVKTDRVEQKSEQKTENTALKLREMAQKLKEKGQESLSRDRKDNTSRRAAMAEGAENQARKDIALAETMENLSDAIESGQAVHLFGLSTKTQIELLETTLRSAQNDRGRNEGLSSEKWNELPIDNETIGYVKTMFPALSVRNLEEIVKIGKDKPGARRLAEKVGKWIKKANGEVVYPQNIQAMETIKKLARATGIMEQSFSNLKNQIESYSRLRAMGIESGSQFRAVLKEFSQFKAKEQEADKAKSLERSLAGKKVGFDFFPTPKTVAADMIERADIQPGMKVLEPSAGNGNIAEQIRETGIEPDVAEISSALREVLEAKGFKVVDNDFLDIQDGYDRIIMNPPFSNNQDIAHLRHAYSLLNPGGKIVSIVGEGAFFRNGKTETSFRDWLDEMDAFIEDLPENTFMDSKLMVNTGAKARLVVLEKPTAIASMAAITNKQIDEFIAREDVEAEIEKVLANTNPYLRARAVIKIAEEITSAGKPGSNSMVYSAGIFNKISGNITISQSQKIENLPTTIAHEILHNSYMYLTDAERNEIAFHYAKMSLEEKRDIMGKDKNGDWIYDQYVRDYGENDEGLLEELGVTEAGRKYTDSRVLRYFKSIVEAFVRLINKISAHKIFQDEVNHMDALMVFREAFKDSDFFEGRDYRYPRGEFGTQKSIQAVKKETSTEKIEKIVLERDALLKKKRALEKAFLDSEKGQELIQRYEVQKQEYADVNASVVSGIKNNPYFKKEKSIKDSMGSGYLMEKQGRYIVVEADRVDTYIQRGYTSKIEIDSLASEAGFENGEQYLEDQLSRTVPIKAETAAKKLLSYTDKLYGSISSELARADELLKQAKDDKNSFYLGMRVGGDIMRKKYKEKLAQWQDRKRKVKAAQEFFGLSTGQFNAIGGNRNVQYMRSDEFETFMEQIQQRAEVEVMKSQAREMVAAQIQYKELQKTDNLRRAMKLPTIKEMNYNQLMEFEKALDSAQFGDSFFTQRQLETVENTELKGIKTLREAREKLAEKMGVEKVEVGSVVVSPMLDKLRYDTALAEKNPFYKILVDETNIAMIEADARFLEAEKTANELIAKARKSRPRTLADKLVQEDKQIFEYIESSEKAALAKKMTNEELEAAEYIRRKFEEMRDYLIAHKTLKKGRENYITHIRRDFFETWKNDGFATAIKEMFEQQKEDEASFEILSGETGEILPLEKFFQYSLHRTGELKASENVARAFLAYTRAFEKKRALDSLIPKIDIFVYSITPTQTTEKGLVMDRSLKKFVNAWLNNKKGRKFDFGGFLKQGGKADIAISSLRMFTSIIDLGLSIPGGIASNFGEQGANYTMQGNKKFAKGIARALTPKGRRIVDKYRNFTGKNPWTEITEVSRNVGDKFFEALFILFRDSQVRANRQYLLGSMTKEEFESETLSPERLAEMKRDMGRWRVVEGAKSIAGNTSAGGVITQYKTWAVPILRSVVKDTEHLIKTRDFKSKEGAELLRSIILVGGLGLLITAILSDSDDDDSFIAKLIKRSTRDLLSIFGALDPTFFTGEPRVMAFLNDIATGIKQLVLLEEYKTSGNGYEEGDLKGINSIKRAFKPAMIKQMEKKESAQSSKPKTYSEIISASKKSSGNKYKTYDQIVNAAK